MGLLKSLRNRFDAWLFAKVVSAGFQRLNSEHLGIRLKEALLKRTGEDKALVVRTQLAKWLKTMADELLNP